MTKSKNGNTQDLEPRQGYKHTTLGWIPKNWDLMEFSGFASKSSMKYDPQNNIDVKKCIELEHLSQCTGELLGYIDSSRQASIKNIFQVGEILFGKLRPYLRKYWLATFDGVCSSEIWVLTSNFTICCNEFLFYFIQGHYFIQSANVTSGSKMPRADWNYISAIPFPIPPLPEQKAIAALLSTWDKAITNCQLLIDNYQLRKKWLMQQLLTGKKRLPGFSGPWKPFCYNDLLAVVKRPVKWDDNELYKLISVRRRSGGIFLRESLKGNQILVKDLRTVNEGDFIFSKMQIVHGASALVTKEYRGAKISGSYIAVVSKNTKLLNIDFLNWYSQLPYFYHQTYISSYGVHIEKMTFDFDTFLQMTITIPSVKEQTAISNILQKADDEIIIQEQKLEALKEQKKGLMQVLLTGKKRLIANKRNS